MSQVDTLLTDSPDASERLPDLDQSGRQAAWVVAVFVGGVSLLFPRTGVLGALIAAVCAVMPWVTRSFRREPAWAVSLIATVLLIAPLESLALRWLTDKAFTLLGGV